MNEIINQIKKLIAENQENQYRAINMRELEDLPAYRKEAEAYRRCLSIIVNSQQEEGSTGESQN